MIKKIGNLSGIAFVALVLVGCSSSSPVINLGPSQIDQKSYAAGYATTIQTEQGVIESNYNVEAFAKGVNKWYKGEIKQPIEEIKKAHLGHLQDSDVSAYDSGVIFASELEDNFKRLGEKCWKQINTPSLTQGIYDAARDLKEGSIRFANDPYISQGNDELLKVCN